jgi:hypothetical protein
MADQHDPEKAKSLEMRIASIEDKLSKMSVSEEDMRGYRKVASLMAGAAGATALSPSVCSIVRPNCILCIITIPQPVHIPTPIIADCIQFSAAGGPTSSTGFEDLGRK